MVLILLALTAPLAAGGAAAQDAPAGPGLGAVRDTLALAPGQTTAQLRRNVVPRSIAVDVLHGAAFVPFADSAWTLDPAAGLFRLAVPADTVVVLAFAYRALPELGVARLWLPSADSLRAAEAVRDSAGVPPPGAARGSPLLAPGALQTRGSITRGVVAGTNRDVSITSGLRLDVSGEVAPGVTLRAALTDENTPILPEGTTQQLSDLDRVFVEVDGRRARARLGDVDLSLPGTRFAPLARQVQGALVEAEVPRTGWVGGGRVLAGGSAVRGRFRSLDLAPIEGVQGPYRLTGEAGEAFVVVVPGSERVYLDGQLQDRGEAGDYTIDYATGEVTFTPSRLITAERRITVDFEYTAGGFPRTLAVASAEVRLFPIEGGRSRATLGARVFREADAASFLDELGLSDADRDAIRLAGDADVLVDGATRVPFDATSPVVLYARRDTLVAGETRSIYVPASPASAEVFRVRFTRVTAGTGDYRRRGDARNGVLYAFVGPGQGDALAARILPRPARRQLVDVTGRVDLMPGVEAFGEWARSVDDANTLSSVGDADDGGGAVEAGLRIRPTDALGGRLSGDVVRRVRSERFRPLDRVRDVEFNRRWNLARGGTPFGSVVDTLGEAVTEGRLAWVRGDAARVDVEGGRLGLGAFHSDRLGLGLGLGAPGTPGPLGLGALDYRLDWTRTGGAGPLAALVGTGGFLRQRGVVSRPVGRFAPSIAVEQEWREQAGALPQDTLLAQSYAFLALRPGLRYVAPGVEAQTTVEWRRESEPLGPRGAVGPLADAARALTVEATGSVRPSSTVSADGRLAYRQRRVLDPFLPFGRETAESVAARLSIRAAPLRRALDVQAVYDALTERAPLLQETYVLVGPDLGAFVWRDGAGEPRAGEPDGVAQVDEFFPETTPLEGAYLRTFIPGDAFVPTIGVGLGLRVRVRPDRRLPAGSPLADALRQTAWRVTVDVRERTRERDVLRVLRLDPAVLQNPGDGTAGTVDGRSRLEAEVTLFPDRPRSGGRLGAARLTTTNRLAAGLEMRLVQSVRAEAYAPLGPRLQARVEAVSEQRRAASEAFASRTYALRGLQVEPRLTWTPSPSVAVSAGALLADRTDRLAPPGRPSGALVLRLPAEARWTLPGRLSAAARVERSDVRLRGGDGASGLALFELTEGRGAGVSWLWGVTAEVGLTERLRATVVYDGRAPAAAPAIQTVRVQLSAVF